MARLRVGGGGRNVNDRRKYELWRGTGDADAQEQVRQLAFRLLLSLGIQP